MTLKDYYGEKGCCLTCETPSDRDNWNGINGEGCLCTDCKCKKCAHYTSWDGRCKISKWRGRSFTELVCITHETKKAYHGRIRDETNITDFLWIPKKGTNEREKSVYVQNWLLETKKLTWILSHKLLNIKEETTITKVDPNVNYETYLPKKQNGEEENQNGKQTNLHFKNRDR